MENENSKSGELSRFKKGGIIFVLSLALTIIILDTTLLNVSLSSIIRDFHTDIQSIQWVITAYSLTLAALTITGGRFGDLFGRKRMFVLGAIIFAVGSFITSISQNIPTMILGESIIEGVGAALMMPATASLLITNFSGKDRRLAFGIWGGIAGAASALGPIVGGYLSTNYTWRWGFRINIFVAIILCLGSIIIPDTKDNIKKIKLDWLGIFLSSIGLLAFVFGVIESSVYGWWNASAPFSIAGKEFIFPWNLSIVPFAIMYGVLFLMIFTLWEVLLGKYNRNPLVSMKLFLNKQFSGGVITTLFLSLSQSGIIFSIPIFLQAVRGYTPFQTGLSLLPMSITLIVVAPLASILAGKFNPKRLIQLGLLINILAMVVLDLSLTVKSTSLNIAPGMILFGIGMGLVMSQINNLTLSAVSIEEAGEASGVNNTLRQVGASFGSAIFGAILLGALAANITAGIQNSSIIPNQLKSQISTSVSNQSSNVEFGGGPHFSGNISKSISTEIVSISHQAVVDANRKSLTYGAIIALLGFFVSFLLPTPKESAKTDTLASGH